MKPFAALLAMLVTVQICHAGPIRNTDIAELNDGILAYATDQHIEAIRLLSPLATSGQPLAQLFLGRIYVHSDSVTRDCASGVSWLVRAAERGNADAAFELAEMYKRADCVAPNEPFALRWYTTAAEHGHLDAPNAAGELSLGAETMATDYAASLYWFRRAVKRFDHRAAYHIGMIYSQGQGVPTDYKEAFKWFDLSSLLSASYERDRAVIARDRVREQLMPAQVAEAQAEAHRIVLALVEQYGSAANSQSVDALLALEREGQ